MRIHLKTLQATGTRFIRDILYAHPQVERVEQIHPAPFEPIRVQDDYPIFLTMREPLSSLVTLHQRHNGRSKPMAEWVARWVWWLHELDATTWPIICVDLDWRGDLARALTSIRLDPTHALTHEPWSRHSLGVYPARRMYEEGDVEGLRREMGVGFEGLLQARDEILPIVRRLGYSGLLWDDPTLTPRAVEPESLQPLGGDKQCDACGFGMRKDERVCRACGHHKSRPCAGCGA